MSSDREKKTARAIQRATGVAYTTCLRSLRDMRDEIQRSRLPNEHFSDAAIRVVTSKLSENVRDDDAGHFGVVVKRD